MFLNQEKLLSNAYINKKPKIKILNSINNNKRQNIKKIDDAGKVTLRREAIGYIGFVLLPLWIA